MTQNSTKPAHPIVLPSRVCDAGLTKREYAAIHILAGLSSKPIHTYDSAAEESVRLADALFKHLDK